MLLFVLTFVVLDLGKVSGGRTRFNKLLIFSGDEVGSEVQSTAFHLSGQFPLLQM